MRTYLTDEIGTPRLGAGLLTSRIWSIITAPTWGSVLPHGLTMHKVTTPVARQAVAQHGEGTSKQTRRSRRTLQGAPGSMCRSSMRSEEHTSELQSRGHLVCRLLLEKKKNKLSNNH